VKFKLTLVLIIAALLAACAPAQADASTIATIVAATLQAANPVQPTAEIVSVNGTVEGTICFPSEGIPQLNLYLQENGSATGILVPHAQNQNTFSAVVPAGNYVAYAWVQDFTYGGSYSQAVACGLSVDCTDHSLVEFMVTAGATTTGVAVCDWYGNPGDVPLPLGVEVNTQPGSISGSLNYPSNFIPSMDVVAFSTDSSSYFYVVTTEGSGSYQIDNLPVGGYYVVAYPNMDGVGTLAGGYSAAVPCGLSVECTDHSLFIVTVTSGQVTTGVDPFDWYPPEGSFPANPVP
jgi:hypothetical protein